MLYNITSFPQNTRLITILYAIFLGISNQNLLPNPVSSNQHYSMLELSSLGSTSLLPEGPITVLTPITELESFGKERINETCRCRWSLVEYSSQPYIGPVHRQTQPSHTTATLKHYPGIFLSIIDQNLNVSKSN